MLTAILADGPPLPRKRSSTNCSSRATVHADTSNLKKFKQMDGFLRAGHIYTLRQSKNISISIHLFCSKWYNSQENWMPKVHTSLENNFLCPFPVVTKLGNV